jgi:acetoin utilization protein AcuB
MNHRKLEQLMSQHPLTVGYEDGMQKASELMLEHHYRHLPVVDRMGEVIGILSDRDVQRAMDLKRTGIDVEYVIAPHRKVKDFMSWPPRRVPSDTPLVDVLRIMTSEKISAILVDSPQNDRIRGIVTTEDLLLEFQRLLESNEVLGRGLGGFEGGVRSSNRP